ncbi:MAG TPA: ATP-binding protein, partial [Flavobacteriales bacterium]|nr:ATP-binding protein [Flavobacteriales bacterium]
LYELDRMAGAGNKVRRGLAVLKSFIGGIKVKVGEVEFGLDIDGEKGSADSGDLEIDLPQLFTALAEAAQERGTAVAILIDEVQYLNKKELSALIMAMHKMQQRQLPLVFMGAGLPTLPALAGDSKSYAERLFSFPVIGPLSDADAMKALQDPVQALGVSFNKNALMEAVRHTKGYPYFLQEWGYQAWNHATSSPITLKVIEEASADVVRRLDENFFRVRYDRLTPNEKDYLRAMAELGEGPQRSSEIAALMGLKVTAAGPVRDKLIKKGMIYSPGHGDTAFTVPLFAEFMCRTMPVFKAKKRPT